MAGDMPHGMEVTGTWGIMGGETMNEVTHPASLSSALPLIATVT